MKEYTKKQLDRIIKESMSDVDEMAYKIQNKQAPQTDKETGEKKIKKNSPRFR